MKQISQANGQYKLIRRGLLAVMVLLMTQFVVGMLVNLYTNLPQVHPGTGESFAPSIPWALQAGGGIALAIHVAIAIALLFGSIALVVRAFMSRHIAFVIGTSIGLVSVLIAFSMGLSFLNRGGDAIDSFAMAFAFMVATSTYAVMFYVTRER